MAANARKVLSAAMLGTLLRCASGAAHAAPPSTQAVDPEAVRLLERMNEVYGALPALNERIDRFTQRIPVIFKNGKMQALPPPAGEKKAAAAPTPDETTVLEVLRPNRLLFEVMEAPAGSLSAGQESRWVCDGKSFWSYSQENHWYTRDRAPGELSGLLKMASLDTANLELLMACGADPFKAVGGEYDSVQLAGSAQVGGVDTSIVELQNRAGGGDTRTELYIGASDHLLYRLVVETDPAPPAPTPAIVGDALDALVTDQPHQRLGGATGEPTVVMRTTYQNRLLSAEAIKPEDFKFSVPPGSLLYTPGFPSLAAGKSLKPLRRIFPGHGRKLRVIRP